jgi:agmatine deiminase
MMPAEFEPHSATLICWPVREEIYRSRMAEAEAAHALLARTIAAHERVVMISAPGHGERARDACGSGVDVVEIPIDDAWCRDSGPIFVRDEDDELVALDFTFNGWGEKFIPFDDDDRLAGRISAHLGNASRRVDMVLEGGSINVDGRGRLVTTEQCLLNPNRNPSLSRDDIAGTLSRELGVETVVWLPHGLALDHDTDGHVDNVAAFTPTGHLLVQGCNDVTEDDHLRCATNIGVARRAAAESGFEVAEIPVLPFIHTPDGRRVVPYMNFYVGNGFVVIPVVGHDADADMVSLIGEYFPGREMVPLDVGGILAVGGGGIHCITQQVPA